MPPAAPTRFSWRSVECTCCSRTPRGRRSCCGYRRHHEFIRPETAEGSIGLGFLPKALPTSARTGRVEMPRMRNFQTSPGPSSAVAKSSGRRCGRKPHHPLQCLPSANPSPCRDSHAVRARQGIRETMLGCRTQIGPKFFQLVREGTVSPRASEHAPSEL